MFWRSAHPLTNRANSLAEILKLAGGSGILAAKQPDLGHGRQAAMLPGGDTDRASRRRINTLYNAAPGAAPTGHPSDVRNHRV
jgi:hypothetical protein